jgi:hypothetical protein
MFSVSWQRYSLQILSTCTFITNNSKESTIFIILKNRDYVFYVPTILEFYIEFYIQLYVTSRLTTYVDSIIRHGEARMAKYTSRGNEVTKTSKNLLTQS